MRDRKDGIQRVELERRIDYLERERAKRRVRLPGPRKVVAEAEMVRTSILDSL